MEPTSSYGYAGKFSVDIAFWDATKRDLAPTGVDYVCDQGIIDKYCILIQYALHSLSPQPPLRLHFTREQGCPKPHPPSDG